MMLSPRLIIVEEKSYYQALLVSGDINRDYYKQNTYYYIKETEELYFEDIFYKKADEEVKTYLKSGSVLLWGYIPKGTQYEPMETYTQVISKGDLFAYIWAVLIAAAIIAAMIINFKLALIALGVIGGFIGLVLLVSYIDLHDDEPAIKIKRKVK